VRISKLAHSAAWIKLSYENQRADQVLVTLKPPAKCQSTFAPPADTVVKEGDGVTLSAKANCASGYNWTPVSGPAPRFPDPDVKVLQFAAPRITGDTVLVLRFTAVYGDSTKEKLVRVTLKEGIPEPSFSLPASLTWASQDTLQVAATLANLAAIKASRDSVLTWNWTVTDLQVDTAWRAGALVLRDPVANGQGKVTLCLSNNSAPVCRSSEVTITKVGGVSVRALQALRPGTASEGAWRAVDGRWTPEWSKIRKNYPVKPGR
jgi:hypothetical protein